MIHETVTEPSSVTVRAAAPSPVDAPLAVATRIAELDHGLHPAGKVQMTSPRAM